MPVLRLQDTIAYGPVLSRRLGRSLGVNLLPPDRKACTFDCIYCQYGRAAPLNPPIKACFPTPDQVLEAVAEIARRYPYADYITFSGNGEPTLHPQFPEIVAEVRRLRDRLPHRLRLALLSNATTVHQPRVRETLALFDAPILKLDAGDPATFAAINRPASTINLETILRALKGIPNLIIQSMLIEGRTSNIHGEALEAWLEALAEIRPSLVQVYSADRPAPETGVERVPLPTLRAIAAEVQKRLGLKAEAY